MLKYIRVRNAPAPFVAVTSKQGKGDSTKGTDHVASRRLCVFEACGRGVVTDKGA